MKIEGLRLLEKEVPLAKIIELIRNSTIQNASISFEHTGVGHGFQLVYCLNGEVSEQVGILGLGLKPKKTTTR